MKRHSFLPALAAGLGLILAGRVAAQTSDGMALIPAGEFTIGDTLDGETNAIPATNVYVSAFYMDTNLVTYSQWQSVYDWATNHGYGFVNAGSGKATNQPVQTMDWDDCVKWCNARSQQAGLTPVYYTDAGLTQVFTNGDYGTTVYPNWAANGYRLPTEAEWEKAARGGLSGQRFPWGDTISESQANYHGDTDFGYDLGSNGFNPIGNYPRTSPGTSPVGSFAPNGYGLYDMAGNVFEWCWDWYAGSPYPAGSPYLGGIDPRGPVGGSFRINERVLRGGNWINDADHARCAYRFAMPPPNTDDGFGFRCMRVPFVVTTVALPNGANGVAYSQALAAFGGQAPYSWTNISGVLPPGLTLAATGLISGTPTNNGTFNFTIEVTDASSNTVAQALTLTVVTIEVAATSVSTNIDLQTGLFYQQVMVVNVSSLTVTGLRITATNLPAIAFTNPVYMVSATGTNTSGEPYVDYSGSLPAGSTNTFTLAYYSAIRRAPAGVGLLVEAVSVTPPANSTGTTFAIRRAFLRPDGKFAVEFDTLAGRTYVIEYSSDLATWLQAQPAVAGTGTTMMWVNSGPPETESPPSSGRYYRVVLLSQ